MASSIAWKSVQSDGEYQKLWLAVLGFFQFETLNDEKDLAERYRPRPQVDFAVYRLEDIPADQNDEYEKLVENYTVTLTRGLCKVLGANETVIVFDPYHEVGFWYPHKANSLEDLLAGFTPAGLYPYGDYCMCVAPTAGVGLFGHPWAMRVWVCGQALIDAVEADKPALLAERL